MDASGRATQQIGECVNGLPAALTITLEDTLSLLDGEFSAFADGVAEGRYAFWLGSGISFERFPGLKTLIANVLEYMRARCDPADPACRYHRALDQAFSIAALSEEERQAIDLTRPVETWALLASLQNRLSGLYSTFLSIEIEGEENDVLVWGGVDVVGTYADDTIEPDAEHFCLAILIKEGFVEELASANWDGLIEKASAILSGGEQGLDVCVRSEDLQDGDQRAKLTKFHGCAVRAREDEATYRGYIIGRQSQIDSWLVDAKMQGLIEHLRSVAIERPTLMLGLSAQDFNIRGLFNAAKAALKWDWPGERPAYVFSEDTISEGQRSLLTCVYGEHYNGAVRDEIKKSAHIQAFAKPLLLALVLYGYDAKLKRLKDVGETDLDDGLNAWIEAGIGQVRNAIARANNGDHSRFILNLIRQMTHAKTLFAGGRPGDNSTLYEPITSQPVSQIAASVDVASSGLPEASVAVGLLGQGCATGDWALTTADADDEKSGAAVLVTAAGPAQVFVLKDAYAEEELYESGRLEETDSAILIYARPLYGRLARSPRKAPGRTGAVQPRRTSINSLLAESGTPEQLMDRFKWEVGL